MELSRWMKMGIGITVLTILSLLVLIAFRISFVNFVDNYELGYKFDTRTGQITILKESGYYVTPPLIVQIHTIDMRPMQVCINANKRVLNCKLVQFDPAGIETFLAWHGRGDYSSYTNDAGVSFFAEILKSYAYDGSGKNYPFLKVLRELKPEEAARATVQQ